MLRGLCFGEEAGARNLVFFRVKWLRPAMKGTSCVRLLRLGSIWFLVLVPSLCFAASGCSCAQFYEFLESVVAGRIGMAA